MTTTTISIDVDAATAKAFVSAPPDERKKIELLLGLRLHELTTQPARSLQQIMDDMGAKARAQGMTDEILNRMLEDAVPRSTQLKQS